jgi:hypothetical protein
MPRRHKQDVIASLRGIFTVIAMMLVFIAFLALVVIVERLALG